jgi:hypothetical protein
MDQFEKLDDLILEHTVPPVQTLLRNQLALTREQIEAYQMASDKQDETLARQATAIEKLQAENKRLVERQSENSVRAPFRVSDDYQFITEAGFWVDRKTMLKVCAKCLLPPGNTVSPLFEAVGLGLGGEEELVWRCGNCGAEYFHGA